MGANGEPRDENRMLMRGRALLLAASASVVAACGSATPAATPLTSGSAAAGAQVLSVTDADNGHAVVARAGDTIVVTLASTYWTVQPPSDPAVLVPSASPQASPRLGGCVPGGGCGTVTATFIARAPGTAVLTATRTSCGEALLCQGSAGRFSVTVTVSG